jgi:rubrerythrin
MTACSGDRLIGASPWEQELYDSLVAHEREERGVTAAYEELASTTASDTARYLVDLILEDERRHHWLLQELSNRVRAMATLEERGPRVPTLDVKRGDVDLLKATRRFLAIERKDRAALRRLARKARRLGGELDALVVGLLQSDTDRHIRILRFIEDRL